jgi:putative cell wall-binding protein
VLLTERNRLSEATRRALRTGGTTEVLLAGGEAAVGAAVEEELEELDIAVTRLAGVDRYGTARALNGWAETTLGCPAGAPETATACVHRESLVVARGDVFADALAGGPLAAARGELLAIVPSPDVFGVADSEAYLREREPVLEKVTVLGGVAALSWYEQWQLDQLTR